MLLAGAKSVLIWCFSFKMVLLAGAKFAHAAAAAQSIGNMIYGWLKIRCFSGAFLGRLWSSWCKMCAHLVFFLEVVLAAGAKRGRLEVDVRAEEM